MTRLTSPIYNLSYNNMSRIQGGVLVGVRQGIALSSHNIASDTLQLVIVDIPTRSKTNFRIIAYYNPPGHKINEDIFDQSGSNTIIIGNLNCHNTIFGCSKTTSAGRHLNSVLVRNKLHILNCNTLTRRDPRTLREELLDFVIASDDIAPYYINSTIHDDPALSDHYLVFSTFTCPRVYRSPHTFYRDPRKTNWDNFAQSITDGLPHIENLLQNSGNSPLDLDIVANKFSMAPSLTPVVPMTLLG